MIPRSLAAILSSVVSQLSILLLLHPSSLSTTNAAHHHNQTLLSLLLHHFLSSSHASVASLCLPLSRKRKRRLTSDPDFDSEDGDITISPRLGELGRVNPGLIHDLASFRAHFNMSPSTFEWLSDLLEPLLDCRDPIGSKLNLSPELRLGIGLYRLSTGSDHSEIARVFRVTEPVARFCSKQLCRVLCTNFRFWVGFPNPNELKSVSEGFESLTGLPNCCGVIGCVRFRIKRVGGPDEIIASQIVVDSNSRLLSIAAGFHGDNGNLKILKSSTLYKDIDGGRLVNSPPINVDSVSVPQYFVGDAGYPLLPWLMVPFSDPNSGSAEQNFDSALHLVRAPLMKTAASLRSWGVLRRPVEGGLRNVVAYIGSCAILHNALLIREDFSALCSDIRIDDSGLDHHDHGLGCSRDASVGDEPVENKARLIRSALAKTAKGKASRTSD